LSASCWAGFILGSPRGKENEHAFNTEIYSRDEVRRIALVGISSSRGIVIEKLTSVDKANVLESFGPVARKRVRK